MELYSTKNQTTHSLLESLDFEVCGIKVSFLELHDKVSTLTFMLDSFMKDMKGMVVEEVTVEEEADEKEEEANQEGEKAEEEKKEAEKEVEENPEIVDATPIQTIPPSVEINTSLGKPKSSKKRKTKSRKYFKFLLLDKQYFFFELKKFDMLIDLLLILLIYLS